MAEMKVLIIDDDNLICTALEREFSLQGISSVSKSNASAGIRKLKEDEFDFVFLDIHLPDANGLDLITKINRISPTTKVVIMSADLNEENREKALIRGASALLEKPFNLIEIKKLAQGSF